MNLFKIVAFLLGLVVAAILAMTVLGMAFALLKLAFVVAAIALIAGGLWKLFGGNGGDSLPPSQGRLDNIELTMDEYKRKLEAQINPQGGKDWK